MLLSDHRMSGCFYSSSLSSEQLTESILCIYVGGFTYRIFQDQSYFCFWKICLGSFDIFSPSYQLPGVSVIIPSWINVTGAVVLTKLQ